MQDVLIGRAGWDNLYHLLLVRDVALRHVKDDWILTVKNALAPET